MRSWGRSVCKGYSPTESFDLSYLNNARLAKSMETFCDCRGVHQVSWADLASDHLVDGDHLTLALHRVVHLGDPGPIGDRWETFQSRILQILSNDNKDFQPLDRTQVRDGGKPTHCVRLSKFTKLIPVLFYLFSSLTFKIISKYFEQHCPLKD